ncbi:Cobalt-precorrin-6x reductase [Actinokineospora spheciospongiae]|uniref:Cobalt-precorrin-6x reductase n=1 Tax=Actinokineospora spheciospongiae TaxID=909613 RepID=W7IT95_9PSEU|nr:Cobalt-precorrin-6x reductase [Actinokineospora spheciospongiae]
MLTVLVLGGTAEARALAAVLHERPGTRVVSSLAGRVARPRLPVGEVRVGGFGGPDKLAEYLRAESVAAVVDATHPFAERISASAATAARAAAVPLVLLRRPGWTPRPGDTWHRVDDLTAAAALLPDLGDRVFLTTGRQGLPAFATAGQWFLVRCVDPPDPPLPARCELLLDRGPYTLDGELALMRAHRVEVLVTKDSGGPLTAAKLDAARELGLPVVVVRRPGTPDVPVLASVPEVVDWLTGVLPGSRSTG